MGELNPLHRLWRGLPQARRRRALHGAATWLAPRPDHPAPPVVPGIAVCGETARASGLGEGARLMLAGLRSLGVPCWDGAAEAPPGVPLVVHANPAAVPLAMLRLGRAAVRGRRIIGLCRHKRSRAAPAPLPHQHAHQPRPRTATPNGAAPSSRWPASRPRPPSRARSSASSARRARRPRRRRHPARPRSRPRPRIRRAGRKQAPGRRRASRPRRSAGPCRKASRARHPSGAASGRVRPPPAGAARA